MSSAVFPSLPGLTWDIGRSAIWDTIVQQTTSGKETRMANQTYPRHQWDLTYSILRQGTVNNNAFTEFSQIYAFINNRQGSFDSFLFTDPDDSSVTGQQIGIGDATTLAFQLVRSFGGNLEPCLAPNVVANVYVNGTLVSAANYAVSAWGALAPGVVTFGAGHAPGAGQAVTVDFTYYWPCRFVDDVVPFNKFMQAMYECQKLSIISLKN